MSGRRRDAMGTITGSISLPRREPVSQNCSEFKIPPIIFKWTKIFLLLAILSLNKTGSRPLRSNDFQHFILIGEGQWVSEDPSAVAKAIESIQSNRYVLPAIQREFVWGSRQIEKLFDSLMQGYPIGSFLFWEVKGENLNEYQFYRFMDKYHQRDHRHNEKINLVGPHNVTAVLDGQQRLTALAIGLKGTYASKLPYYRWDSDWAFPPRSLYLNLLALSDDIEFKYDFRMLRKDDAKKRSENRFWFPVGAVLQFKDLGEIVEYCLNQNLMREENRLPYQALMRLWQVITQNPTITYFLEEEQDLDRVLNIFIRVNSGGTQLSYSDMLLSIATAEWQEHDAREEIYGLVDKLNEIGEGFNFNSNT